MAIIIKNREHIPHSFERLVNNLIKNTYNQEKEKETGEKALHAIHPKINVLERSKAYELQFALPGWTKGDVEVQVDEDVLIVKGSKNPALKDDITYHSYEFDFGQFEKRFELPQDKFGEVNANLKDGILTVTVEKKEKTATNKKITVS